MFGILQRLLSVEEILILAFAYCGQATFLYSSCSILNDFFHSTFRCPHSVLKFVFIFLCYVVIFWRKLRCEYLRAFWSIFSCLSFLWNFWNFVKNSVCLKLNNFTPHHLRKMSQLRKVVEIHKKESKRYERVRRNSCKS